MITRIVRMSFDPEKLESFREIFDRSKVAISSFPGCEGLTLLSDSKAPNVLFTYSHWRDEEALNAYRHSDLFKTTWAATRLLFNDKPHAWSLLLEDKVK